MCADVHVLSCIGNFQYKSLERKKFDYKEIDIQLKNNDFYKIDYLNSKVIYLFFKDF